MSFVRFLQFVVAVTAGVGVFLFFTQKNTIPLNEHLTAQSIDTTLPKEIIPEKPKDIEPQLPLSNPPAIVKALYATGWSAGYEKRLSYLIDLIKRSELNAIVIDIKDYTGKISYDTDIEKVNRYGAEEARITFPNKLIKRLHDEGIYVIGRMAVFQDQQLVLHRPELAVLSSSTKAVWRDRKGLAWIDAGSREAWEYNTTIAKEALQRGFDEINFDYIRFPSDGNLSDMIFPLSSATSSKTSILKQFFSYLRAELPMAKTSADIFGLVLLQNNDQGIGQYLEDIIPYFDFIAPMVYPSHYASGSFGFANPAAHPYDVVYFSLEKGIQRIKKAKIQNPNITAQLRPWLQDFDLGADYTANMIRAQIDAFDVAASTTPELNGGWLLWSPSNVYTTDALHLE
ncbi:MAG TPA: putative glycoside hydrolase [Candidatus Paceibacterota bacterium]